MRGIWLTALILGCSGDDGEPSEPTTTRPTEDSEDTGSTVVPTGTTPTGETSRTAHTGTTAVTGLTASTGDSGLEPTLVGQCTLASDNSLRAWCDLQLDPPGPVEVSFAPTAGGTERTHTGSPSAASQRVGLYLMTADTDYTWTARRSDAPGVEQSGSFRTGALPPAAQLAYASTGTPAAEHYAHVSPCDGANTAIVTRSDDQVVWYEPFPQSQKFVGFELTEDDTLLGLSGPDTVTEVDWMGEVQLSATNGVDFAGHLHHDLTRSDGYTYALFMEPYYDGPAAYQIDGFVVLDDQGAEVARWHLQDHWVPTATHPRHGVDVTHSNAISVQDGVALVSIRHLSTVVAIRADPTAKDFGTVLWRLGGYGVDAVWGSDFTLLDATGGSGSFQEQHHAMLLPDGRLSLFDNRIASDADSRALEIELDTGAGTATIVEDYPLPSHCHFQGGSFRTASGHAVTTCAPRGLVYEFAPGTDTISWQTRITCASGSSGVVPRMIPVE